jgi:hypothetical protein
MRMPHPHVEAGACLCTHVHSINVGVAPVPASYRAGARATQRHGLLAFDPSRRLLQTPMPPSSPAPNDRRWLQHAAVNMASRLTSFQTC